VPSILRIRFPIQHEGNTLYRTAVINLRMSSYRVFALPVIMEHLITMEEFVAG